MSKSKNTKNNSDSYDKRSSILAKNGVKMVPTGAGYWIVRQGVFDYSNYLEDITDEDRATMLPQFLEISIALPLVNSPNDIDITVLPKEVSVKATIHDFIIPLPFEIFHEEDYKANWKAPVITLTVKVKPPPKQKEKLDFRQLGIEVLDETVVDEIPETEELVEQGDVQLVEEDLSGEPTKTAKFAMLVDEKVCTILIYVPFSDPDSVVVEDNKISLKNKKNQNFELEVHPPFPLLTKPHVVWNPVNLKLIFTENLEEENKEEEDIAEKSKEDMQSNPAYELQNPFIFQLEDM